MMQKSFQNMSWWPVLSLSPQDNGALLSHVWQNDDLCLHCSILCAMVRNGNQSLSRVNSLSLQLSKICRCLLWYNWPHSVLSQTLWCNYSPGPCWAESDARKHQKVVYVYSTYLSLCFPPISANTFCLSVGRMSQCLFPHHSVGKALSIYLFLLIPAALVSAWSVHSSLLSLGIFVPPGWISVSWGLWHLTWDGLSGWWLLEEPFMCFSTMKSKNYSLSLTLNWKLPSENKTKLFLFWRWAHQIRRFVSVFYSHWYLLQVKASRQYLEKVLPATLQCRDKH